MTTMDDNVMRTFDTGATRDTADGKVDMEGFTHPMVEKQFAKYMNMHRLQSDGQLRDSDNWQKGICIKAYMKSMRRHMDDVWLEHRGFDSESGIIAALCGIIFNAKGYLLEHLKEIDYDLQDFDGDEPTPELKKRQEDLMFAEEDATECCSDDCSCHTDVGYGSELLPDVCETPADPLKEQYGPEICQGCLSRFKTWDQYPCDRCSINTTGIGVGGDKDHFIPQGF